MDPCQVDLKALSVALDDHDPDRDHFLHLQDGSLWTFVFSESTDETRARHQEIQENLGRTHCRVPSMTTQEAYEEIEDFIEDETRGAVQEELFDALERRGGFRGFREAILRYPEEHQQWITFRKERSGRRLASFLESLRISDGAFTQMSPG